MIRFNPDGYVYPEKGEIPTPWTYTPKRGVLTIKKWKKAWDDRLEVLCSTVEYCIENKLDKTMETIELYY